MTRRFVSVKIGHGWDNEQLSTEAAVMRHVQGNPDPGSKSILHLHDAFVIRRPNGYHEYLVTETVIPLDTLGADG